MRYLISEVNEPLVYASSGMLIHSDQFLHPRRSIDTYVLLLILHGTLFITMDQQEYEVGPNQFLLLLPGKLHFGTSPSKGMLSYYWMHFSMNHSKTQLLDLASPPAHTDPSGCSPENGPQDSYLLARTQYSLPVFGDLGRDLRTSLIFQTLLDMTKRSHYQIDWRCHYLSSYLLLEISHETAGQNSLSKLPLPDLVIRIHDLIQAHYSNQISSRTIAEHLGYHPVYLERYYRKYTGTSITSSIQEARIEASKNLLLNADSVLSLEEIAVSCGFSDVKYYMRIFKRLVGMTPTQYKRSLSQRKVNT